MSREILIVLLTFINSANAQEPSPNLGLPPKELPQYDTVAVKLNWRQIVEEHYLYFASDGIYENGGGDKDTIYTTRISTMAMFGGVYGWGQSGFWKSYNEIVKPFYESTTVQLALYNWIKSYYWDAYIKLPDWRKKIYKNMLTHSKQYVSTCDYSAELKIFEESPNLFIYKGPKGQRGNYGRMEAFIFRRVHKKEMTLQEISDWILVLQKDLNTLEQ